MIEDLKSMGLTDNEAKVYLALAKLGVSTATPIRNHVGLHTSRVYEALDSLLKKGLVSYFIRNNVKHFKAQDPEVMFEMLEEKKERIAKIIPQIRSLHDTGQKGYEISLYEGYKGLRQIYDHVLSLMSPSEEILVLGAESERLHLLSQTYFREYTSRRIRRGIKMRMICNHDAMDTANAYSGFTLTQVRILPRDARTPSPMNIYPDKVSILLLKEKPAVFHIECREVAESYRTYFEFLWEMSSIFELNAS